MSEIEPQTADQIAAARAIKEFDRNVAGFWSATKQFARDVTAPVWAFALRWRRKLRVVAEHEEVARGVFDQHAEGDDHMGYRVRFVEISRKPAPERAELLELAEVVDGLASYGDNPLPRLVARAETPIVIQAPVATPQVQGFAGLPIPGMGLMWKGAAIGAAAAAVAGWGAFGVQQMVVFPRLEKQAEKNAAAVARLEDAIAANRSLSAKLDNRDKELAAAKAAINETAARAAEQMAAAQRRWKREQAAMVAAIDAQRRAVDEASAGRSSRGNDVWLRDNGLAAVDPGAGQGPVGAPTP
jgi:hypothetical protein